MNFVLIPIDLGVIAEDEVQDKDTLVILSCTVTGLTKELDNVKWTKSDDTPITSGVDGFIITTGSSTFAGQTQTTTLAVPPTQSEQDTSYNCIVTSNEHAQTDRRTTVQLFSE